MSNIWQLIGKPYQELLLPLGLAVADIELEQIGDQSYLSFTSLGISAVLPDNATIGALQLHTEGHEGFSGYAGEMLFGLSFSDDREQVRNILGDPTRFGQAAEIPLLGIKPAWDLFSFGGMQVHVEYTIDGRSTQMITIS